MYHIFKPRKHTKLVLSIGPIISPIAFELTVLFGVSFTKVSLLTGYSVLATACFGIVVSPIARKYGRRIPLIFSMSCAFAGCLWGGYANSYNSLLGARVVQGLCVCMFESLNFVVVGDLYYVHERGVRVAVVTTTIVGIGTIPPIASGKVASDLGWRWIFWLLAIFMGIGILLTVFFGFETAYNRNAIYNTDVASQDVRWLSLTDFWHVL
jgi:MFS family permease